MSSVKKSSISRLRSPIKWAGGKGRIAHIIQAQLDATDNRVLVEPFLGSGSFFLNSNFDEYHLNDSNHILINLFLCIKRNPKQFIDDVKVMFNDHHNQDHVFQLLKREYNRTTDVYEKTLLFFYLNRHCYNGLYRENQKGFFNVPFGHYKKVFFPEDEIYAFNEKAKNAYFYSMDYKDFLNKFLGKENHAIYADPPYTPTSDTSNFSEYQGGGFTAHDHESLIDLAVQLRKNNTVVISNHATSETTEWYKNAQAKLTFIDVQRTISCKTNERKAAKELLACFN